MNNMNYKEILLSCYTEAKNNTSYRNKIVKKSFLGLVNAIENSVLKPSVHDKKIT
jgi:hypothetical protein